MYTVKQVAEKMGISAHTLRFYDKEGLLPHIARDGNNVRLFSDRDLERIYLVQCLRETGMPLAEVKEYIQLGLIGSSTLSRRYQMIQTQAQRAEQQLAEMEQRVETLRRKVKHYDRLLAEQADAERQLTSD